MSVKKLSRYDLVAVIAQGQLGPVWEGFDPDIRRKVTIKVAPVDHLSQQAADALVARFRAEARVAGKLLHPNIVGVYDAGVESGLAYIVAETVSGATLDAMLRSPSGVPPEAVGRIMVQVLAALDHAHGKGEAHLGLQPPQVLVAPNGSVKVADFGAVAAAEPDDSTRAKGSLSEPIRCLAPEQVLGLEADARSDLWAAGVMLYRLWTGHWPFHADSDFGLIQQIIKQPHAAPSTRAPGRVPPLGAEHDQLIARALAKSSADRYASAREFAADLSRIVAREAASGTLGGTAAGRAAVLNAVAAASAVAAPAAPPAPPPAAEALQAEQLAHWKRIEASARAADFDAFLALYPSGDRADLARNRLRALAGAGASTNGTPTVAPPPAVDDDVTRVIPLARLPAAPPHAPKPMPPAAAAVAAQPGAGGKPAPKRGLLVVLGAVLVVGAAAAFMLQRGGPPDATPALAPAALAPVADAAASASAAPPPAASAAEPVAASVAAVAASAAAEPAPAALVPAAASQPALPKALTPRELAARKAAADALAKAKSRPASAVVAADPPRPVEPERPAAPVVEAPKVAEAPASVAPAAATEPCGKRVLLARLACMKESCVRAEWARHPQCVDWRRMEESRQRGEQQN